MKVRYYLFDYQNVNNDRHISLKQIELKWLISDILDMSLVGKQLLKIWLKNRI